jgi:hypothetical protein
MDSWIEAQLAGLDAEYTHAQAGQDAAPEVDLEPLRGESLKREFQQLHDRRDTLLKRMTHDHPDVKALDLEIADCRHELEVIIEQRGETPGPAESHTPALTPVPARRSMTNERSVDRDAADDQRQILRRAIADADLRHTELAAAEGRAVENLIAARKRQIAKIEPALVPESVAAQSGWKNLIVVISFGLSAALIVNAIWPASSAAGQPSATVDNVAEFEAEFGLPVLGMISLGSI